MDRAGTHQAGARDHEGRTGGAEWGMGQSQTAHTLTAQTDLVNGAPGPGPPQITNPPRHTSPHSPTTVRKPHAAHHPCEEHVWMPVGRKAGR